MFVPRFVFGAAGRRVQDGTQRGFSLPELIAVMVIVTIVAAVSAPKFWGSGFDEVKLQQQTLAGLRFAHRFAITQQRTVCVAFTGGPPKTTATFTYHITYGLTACATNLVPPGGGTAPFTVVAAGSASYSTATDFAFNRTGLPINSLTGLPVATQTITLNNGLQVVVEATTGYVH